MVRLLLLKLVVILFSWLSTRICESGLIFR